ncbi:hypothetical protein SK128_022073 [Halocaridina rubra]|uniref:Uncharacterized protein n=1 Tax=Halocaridina rubra TaxID=373956 RepID=A0AAN8X9K7_HALRR
MSGGGLTAAGLIVLLLAFIGIGVGIYYAYICLRARPVRPREHTDCEDGPLIADPDVNGNHEDVPVEASAPVDDIPDEKSKALPNEHDGDDKWKNIAHDSNGPVDEMARKQPKEKEEVLVPIEVITEPAKLNHETEIAQVLKNVAPLGFAAPIVHFQKDGKHVQQESPKRVECADVEKAKPEIYHPVTSPVPVFVPVPSIGKKQVTDSDEEDGLLLQKCASHDDSLEPESCSELTTLSNKENRIQTEAISPSDKEEATTAEITLKKANHMKCDETLEDLTEDIPDNNQSTKPLDAASETDIYGWKKEESSVERSLDSTPEEELVSHKHQTVLMNEEVENLHSSGNLSDFEGEIGEPVITVPELNDHVENPQKVENHLAKEAEVLLGLPSDVNIDEPVKGAKYPEVVYLETSKPYPYEKELESSESSDDETSTHIEPSTDAGVDLEDADVKDTTEAKTNAVSSISEMQNLPEDSSTVIAHRNSENTSPFTEDTVTKDYKDDIQTKYDIHESVSPVIQVESSESPVNAAVPAKNDSLFFEATENTVVVSSDVPLEAESPYYVDPVDDGNTLAMIKEEGSVDADSDSTDTDTSEPEITHYTFSKEAPSASTSNILADEISTTLEPEVTKYSVIPELEETQIVDINSQIPKEESVEVSLTNNKTGVVGEKAVKLNPKLGSSTVIVNNSSQTPGQPLEVEMIPSLQTPEVCVISSGSESEGDEAEHEVKEEIVHVPVVRQSHAMNTATPEVSVHKNSEGNKTDLQRIAASDTICSEQKQQVTVVSIPQMAGDFSPHSSSLSPSSSSDLSDDELTQSSPTKSKIPRLIDRQGS